MWRDTSPIWAWRSRLRHALSTAQQGRGVRLGLAVATTMVALASVGLAVQSIVSSGQRGVPSSLLLFLVALALMARYGSLRSGLLIACLGSAINLAFALISFSGINSSSLHAGIQVELFVLVAASIVAANEQRRRAVERASSLKDFVQAISDGPHTGVFAVDHDGRVTSVNGTAAQTLGIDERDVLGQDLHEMVHGTDTKACPLPAGRCALHSMMQLGSAVRTGEAEIANTRGARLSLAYTAHPLVRGDKVCGMIVAFHDISEERRIAEALRRSEQQYRRLVDRSPDGILVTDQHGYIVMANTKASNAYGYPDSNPMVGLRINELVATEECARLQKHYGRVLQSGIVGTSEHTAVRRDGSTFPVEIRTSSMDAEDESRLVHVCVDISERRQTEQALRINEMCTATRSAAAVVLAQSMTLGEAASGVMRSVCQASGWDAAILWLEDARTHVLRCDTVWRQPGVNISGLEDASRQRALERGDDLPGHVWEHNTAAWLRDFTSEFASPRALMASTSGMQTAACLPILVGGQIRGAMELFTHNRRDRSEELLQTIATVAGQLGQFIERKEVEKALEHQAHHDSLTDLPNRTLLHDRISRVLTTARGRGTSFALLLMDLDRFKEINDTLGHQQGDVLLQQVSVRLQAVLGGSATVARLGGDEFAMLLPSTDAAGGSEVAETVLRSIEHPYQLDESRVDVGGSIGIAVYPRDGADAETLLQHADVAMYVAKRAGVGYSVYAAERDHHSPDRLGLIAELRQTIEQKRLLVYYQPKVNLRTGQVQGVEALTRWPHPELGLIPPDQFVPLAERSGMHRQLGYFVLGESIRQCEEWRQVGLNLPVAVNLSAGNLHDPQLVSMITDLLQGHGLNPESLTVEITESAVMVDASRAIETLSELRTLGVRISIDDFGTGYSSLAHLREMPAHEIKIDRSFIVEMAQRSSDAFIARSIIDLGHNLGMEVVAEGVESEEIWSMLNGLKCDHGQGYHLNQPAAARDFIDWLRTIGEGGLAQVPVVQRGPRRLPTRRAHQVITASSR